MTRQQAYDQLGNLNNKLWSHGIERDIVTFASFMDDHELPDYVETQRAYVERVTK